MSDVTRGFELAERYDRFLAPVPSRRPRRGPQTGELRDGMLDSFRHAFRSEVNVRGFSIVVWSKCAVILRECAWWCLTNLGEFGDFRPATFPPSLGGSERDIPEA